MIRTFETRIGLQDDKKAFVLDDLARRMCIAERKIYAFLAAGGEWKAGYYRHIYQNRGLSSAMFRSAKAALDGKLVSISELAKLQAVDLQNRIDAKMAEVVSRQNFQISGPKKLADKQCKRQALTEKIDQLKLTLSTSIKEQKKQKLIEQIKRLVNKIDQLIKESTALSKKLDSIPFALHQHKRRLAVLQLKLARAKASVDKPRICFGTNKLARQQNELKLNGFANHAEWKKDWTAARNGSFHFVGVANMDGGNEVAKLALRKVDGLFDLELRVPPAMREAWGETIRFESLNFNHGHHAIIAALENRQPLTVRFVRDETSWKAHVTIDQPTVGTRFNDDLGCLGVDFNADHVAATLADRFGNPIRSWNIPMVTYGLSANQTTDLTRKVAKQIVRIAAEQHVPVAAEDLDFSRKKAQLTSDSEARYARMLSSLAYSSFQRALASACARHSIHLKLVNSAFTSLIGRTKFAHRYGLSVHAAAALSIARRAMKFSENLPKPVEGKIILPFDDGDRVTLPRPVRIEGRHVWSSWRKLNSGYKAALAAHRLARRKSRSMELTPDGPNSGMAFKGRVSDPLPVGNVQGVPG
jgi:IS605 OrfB family transposase